MKRSQKNAIGYAVRAKKWEMLYSFLRVHDLLSDFEGSGYKYPVYYLKKRGILNEYRVWVRSKCHTDIYSF